MEVARRMVLAAVAAVSVREAGIDFAAPASSHPKSHPTTDDIDYQTEADFSGILAPGPVPPDERLSAEGGR